MKCPKCDQYIKFDPSLADDKCVSLHMLWYHPTEQQIARSLVEMYLTTQEIVNAYSTEDYIRASMIASDLSTLALRVKKYADMKLLGEI